MNAPARPESVVNGQVLEEMARMASCTPAGCFVEVGVYKGGSASYLYEVAEAQGRTLFLFDTFTGIPYSDEGDSHVVGDFGATNADEVAALFPRAIVTAGIFPQSCEIVLPRVAFAHLDCDQYRAVRESAEFLSPLMVPGGVIWMDDPDCLEGAARAARDVFGDRIERAECLKWFVRF